MKLGVRTPSLKRRLAARTSVKRYIRHSMGLKAPRGYGFITNPRKALYNRVYNRTTISIDKLLVPTVPEKRHAPARVQPLISPAIDPTGTVIRSSSVALTVTAQNFSKLREEITAVYEQRELLLRERGQKAMKRALFTFLVVISYPCVFGFFYHGFRETLAYVQADIAALDRQLQDTTVKLHFSDQSQLEKSWLNCIDGCSALMASAAIWDVTYARQNNRVRERTIAKTSIERTRMLPNNNPLPFITSDLGALHFVNANGPDLYIYPTFAILFKDRQRFGIFDLVSLDIRLEATGYLEEDTLPRDATVAGRAWKKANKDGSPDRRFTNNYQIPIAKYGQFTVTSRDGLEEQWMFSDFDAFTDFTKAFVAHIERLREQSANTKQG